MVKVAWHSAYEHPLPEGHRFPMIKYSLIREQLLHEGSYTPSNFFTPEELGESEILRVHDAAYWEKLKSQQLDRNEERRTGFPLTPGLIEREVIIMGGTVACTQHALEQGISLNIAGGTHHAFSDRGEGFCLLNDQALAARLLLDQGLASSILIIDLDVHQGNGTAQIFQDESRVFTFSMHGASNYPMHKEKSDLDLGLPDGVGDEDYLAFLKYHLPILMEEVTPDFVFYQCGVDILSTDKLGRLGLSRSGCLERDRYVFETCLHAEVPLTCSMGGGYSKDIREIVEAHCNTFRLAQHYWG